MGSTTTAVRKTVCPERRVISPRNLDAPWRVISLPAASMIAASPSRMAMNGYVRSPTRNRTSPTFAVRSSPTCASVASCAAERGGLDGGAMLKRYSERQALLPHPAIAPYRERHEHEKHAADP